MTPWPNPCHEQHTKDKLLWWLIPNVLAGMPMPFIHPERRLNSGSELTAYDDEVAVLHTAGVRAVVSLLNIPSDGATQPWVSSCNRRVPSNSSLNLSRQLSCAHSRSY